MLAVRLRLHAQYKWSLTYWIVEIKPTEFGGFGKVCCITSCERKKIVVILHRIIQEHQFVMITTEQAKDLIDAKKYIIKDDKILKDYHIVQTFPMDEKIELAVGNGDDSMMFTWQINQGQKDSLRMSLHCQQYESNIGLFRVDYNRGHKNPASAPADLPAYFRPYIGKIFGKSESHVHIHVSSDKQQMLWAMPIEVSDIELKVFDASPDSVAKSILAFAKAINIQTIIKVERSVV